MLVLVVLVLMLMPVAVVAVIVALMVIYRTQDSTSNYFVAGNSCTLRFNASSCTNLSAVGPNLATAACFYRFSWLGVCGFGSILASRTSVISPLRPHALYKAS